MGVRWGRCIGLAASKICPEKVIGKNKKNCVS